MDVIFEIYAKKRTRITVSDKPSQNLDYVHLLCHFQLPSIKSRFLQHDMLFIYNIQHGRLDCTELVSLFSLSAPARRTRSLNLWHIPYSRVNTIQNSPFRRIPSTCNDLLSSRVGVDFFAASIVLTNLPCENTDSWWAYKYTEAL